MIQEKKKTSEAFHIRHRNFFVGTFLFAVVLGLIVVLVAMLAKVEFFEESYDLYARFEANPGLKKGSQINTTQGFQVGVISKIALDSTGYVLVTMNVKKRYMFIIKKDCTALPKQDGFVGDWKIVLSKGNESVKPANKGDTLQPGVAVTTEQIIAQVVTTVQMVQKILQPITDGKGTIGRVIMEDSLYRSVQKIMRSVDVMMASAQRTLRGVDTLLTTFTNTGTNANGLVDSLNAMTVHLNTVMRDLNKVVGVYESLPRDLQKTMDGVNRDTKEVETLLKAVQKHWLIRKQVKQVAGDTMRSTQ